MCRKDFICKDCGFDTFHNEYYMLVDSTWRTAVEVKDDDIMLCIGCIENRLGRKLESSDFIKYPINYNYKEHSERLRDRIGLQFYLNWRECGNIAKYMLGWPHEVDYLRKLEEKYINGIMGC